MHVEHRLKSVFLFLSLIITLPSFSQLITEQFTCPEFIEDFDKENEKWPIFTNSDNLFVIQNGEYILNRKNKSSQYAALTEWSNTLESFDLYANIKLVQANDDYCNIGIIIMAQAKGEGFVIEINKNRQYRVKQLVGSTYKSISGDAPNFGWVKSSNIKPTGQYNVIEVKSFNKNYDIYINGSFEISFSEKTYTSGRMGIVIGPNTNGLVDYFYVYSNQKFKKPLNPINGNEKNTDTPIPIEQSTDMVSILTETIVRLKTQINKLNNENEDLKRQISSIESNVPYQSTNDTNQILTPDETKQLILLYGSTKTTNDSLKSLLFTYKKIQEMLSSNENSDIIISLSNVAKNEKVQNDILNQNNKILKDSVVYYRTMYNKYKPSVSKPITKSSTSKPSSNIKSNLKAPVKSNNDTSIINNKTLTPNK